MYVLDLDDKFEGGGALVGDEHAHRLGATAGFIFAQAMAVNSNGSIITGSASIDGTTETAAIWTIGAAPTLVTNASGVTYSIGYGIAGSGNNVVIVGRYQGASALGAFKWTSATGMVLLPFLPGAPSVGPQASASATSGDGTRIVGYSDDNASDANSSAAALWTSSTSVMNLSAGAALGNPKAAAISPDGHSVVGGSGAGAWVWNNGAIQLVASALGSYNVDLSPYILQSASAVSSNGKIIAGNAALSSNADVNVGWIAKLE